MSEDVKYDSVVRIPPIGREARIGSALNYVFSVMAQTEKTQIRPGRKVIWDFSDCRFLHPFYLAALAVLKQQYSEFVKCENVPEDIRGYLNVVYFHKPLTVEEEGND